MTILSPEGSSIGHTDRWMNRDLASLLHNYVVNPKEALEAITLKTDRSQFLGQGKETAGFYDILRMELGKEALLQHAAVEGANKRQYGAMLDWIEKSQLRGNQRTNAKPLAHWAALQHSTGISEAGNHASKQKTEQLWKSIRSTERLFRLDAADDFSSDFRKTMTDLADERISAFETYVKTTDTVGAKKYNPYIHLQRAVTPLDLLRDMNDAEKLKATAGKFVRQFNAGSKDPQNITSVTLYPYFLFARLLDDLNKVGLGFSNKSMQSTGDLLKNIMLRRVIPVATAVTYYDWLDDTAKELTGSSLTGTFASGLANVDLAYRRIGDATGWTDILKDEKTLNPALRYYYGQDEYQNYEERKRYYESGYDPMRKGRYWTFGGVNEFRGGQIAYWEPNFVRRLNSDYQDKALYDGYWDKWSHSWLPTPTNPFSPIFALSDPYWLEKKHDKDRPYTVSGTLFSEGTPWGAVLNPTLGELIKPQKELHTDLMGSGRDVKALILRMNQEIKQRALANENLLLIKGNQIEPVRFTAYNAPTMDERIYSLQIGGRQNQAIVADYGYYGGGITPGAYLNRPDVTMADNATSQELDFSVKEKLTIDAAAGGIMSNIAVHFAPRTDHLTNIEHINRGIALKAQFDRSQGVMTPEKLLNSRLSQGMALLDDVETMQDLLNVSTGSDLIKESALSMRLLFGIYGYAANRTMGFGDNTEKRLATSADMDSPFRTFWDSGFGGFGGETMEIARRFMPDYKRGTHVNPLLNEMPDWLPERMRFGDPFTLVPKGEMRLPGKGYESLNRLHPDQFGSYGAYDRFKILADIAPYSPEYKVWKAIAQKTIMSPTLKEEMKEVKARAALQGKQHEFYEYQFLGRGLTYDKGTITQILDRGKFKIHGSDKVFRLAGVKLKADEENDQSTQELLGRYLHVGQEITYAVDENEAYRNNHDVDRSINAAIFIDGQNLSQSLLSAGIAEKRKGDTSAAATIAKFTEFQRLRGAVYEAVTHLDVPWLSDQYLRIRSPLESYKAEQVYGTPYQTWSDPIGTFLLPAFERSISNHRGVNVGQAADYLHRLSENIPGISPLGRKALTGAYMLSNRGAFMGGVLAYLVKPESGKSVRIGARSGSLAMTIGSLYTRMNDPYESMLGFGQVGFMVAAALKKSQKKGAAVGAALGMMFYGANNSILEPQKMWIPDRVKKKWDTEAYFDRLTYIKYSGLYRKAADMALEEENVDIDALIARQERDAVNKQKIRESLMEAKHKLSLLPENNVSRKYFEGLINEKMARLQQSQVVLRAGPWTQSALAYRQARDSTMYGLPKETTWTQLIRAVPKLDREYFLALVSERDAERREEIKQYSFPYLRRALKKAWGEEQPELEKNASYFANHNLPDFTWSGWRPDVDLADIKIKTIENEGMLIGDFGFYESQRRDSDVIAAPALSIQEEQNSLILQANLMLALRGFGLSDVDVNVQPASTGGVAVLANVKDIAQYGLKQTMEQIFRLM